MSENLEEQKQTVSKEIEVINSSKEGTKEIDSQPNQETKIEHKKREEEKENKEENEEKDNESEDEEYEEEEDDNESVQDKIQDKEEKDENKEKDNIGKEEEIKGVEEENEEKEEKPENKFEEKEIVDKNEEITIDNKNEEADKDVVNDKDKKKEENIEEVNKSEDKNEIKKEEIEENKKEFNYEDKKEDKEEEIKIIKKKITLKQPESFSQKEESIQQENKQGENKEKELNPSNEKKAEKKEKQKEDNKIIIDKRKRYTFNSNNNNLNDEETSMKNVISEKKNHQIYISKVASTAKKDKEHEKPILNQNQTQIISKSIKYGNNCNPKIQVIQTPIKNIRNTNTQQRIHQELKKIVKTEQRPNQPRKYEISKPNTIISNTNKLQENLNNKISYITQQNKLNSPKNNIQNVISNRRTRSTFEDKTENNLDIKVRNQNNYNQPRKYEINRPLRDNNKQLNSDTSKRITTSVIPISSKQVNFIIESKYSTSHTNQKKIPPTPDTKDKNSQKVYSHVKIDLSKYNTEKKLNPTMKSLYGYNSMTLDNRQKRTPKLKYYERCPNCGYHLNDSAPNYLSNNN